MQLGLDHVSDGPLGAVPGWPVRAAVAVTDARGTLDSTGDTETVRPWASVTKLLTTVAVLLAVEEGSLTLDLAAGPPGSTVAHLLAHASGLGFDGGVQAPPATRRIYSNAGFDELGAVLTTATGMPFADYLADGVLEPLGLTGTRFSGSPGAGASGPLTDLVAVGRELLAPTLLAPATVESARRAAFPHLDGMLPGFGRHAPNDWGLGFELRGTKAPHWTATTGSPATFGHFGRSGAFLWIDPDAGLACAAVSDTPFGPWARRCWAPLGDAVLAAWPGPDQTERR